MNNNVVYIEATINGKKRGGTGVVMKCGNDRIVLTCLHVINDTKQDAENVRIWPVGVGYVENTSVEAKINEERLDRKRYGSDAADLAILEIESNEPAWTGISKLREPSQNQEITIQGYPLGQKILADFNNFIVTPTDFVGRINLVKKSNGLFTYTGDATAQGVSGGPAIDKDNCLLGLLRGKWAPSLELSLSICIGSHWIQKLCEQAGYQTIIEDAICDRKETSKNVEKRLKPSDIAKLAGDCVNDFLSKEDAEFALYAIDVNPAMINNNPLLTTYYTNIIMYLSARQKLRSWLKALEERGFVFVEEWLN